MTWWMWLAAWLVGIPLWITVAAILRRFRLLKLHEWDRDDIIGSLIFWPITVPFWAIILWAEWLLDMLEPPRRAK